ncbi:MAG: hypothetical protein Q9214_004893 [Letrouitia sp. 1 TL-2023]
MWWVPFIYLTARALYRLTLHSLARFPGPKLRAISHLPQTISGIRGRQPFDVRDLHRAYGDVVRVAPDTLSFITPGSWKDIYGHGSVRQFSRHGYARLRPDVHNLLTAPDEDHARQRAAFSRAFSEKAIREQEPLIDAHINRLIDQLQRKAESQAEIDMVKWLEFVTFDIIGDLALSTQFGCVESSDYHPWVSLLMSFFKSVTYVINAQAFGPLFPLLMLFAPFADLKKGKDHVRMSAEKVQQRLAAGEDPARSDIWTYVLRHKDEKAMSEGEMESNGALILPAGTETISTALCGTIYLLSQNPHALKKLRNELQSHISSEKDITIAAITKLPYLHLVIDESLRLYPPFSGGLKRKAQLGGGFVSNYFVPEGAIVSVYQLAAYSSPANFNQPDRFIPERWLPSTDPEYPKFAAPDQKVVFEPFSVGPKNCIGKQLAYAEMGLILSRFLWRFDFTLLDDGFNFEQQRVFMFREKPPLRLQLRSQSREGMQLRSS